MELALALSLSMAQADVGLGSREPRVGGGGREAAPPPQHAVGSDEDTEVEEGAGGGLRGGHPHGVEDPPSAAGLESGTDTEPESPRMAARILALPTLPPMDPPLGRSTPAPLGYTVVSGNLVTYPAAYVAKGGG